MTVVLIWHHNDPPCTARLINGYCPECKFTPDMQSTCFHYYCLTCNVPLINLACPKCGQAFKKK